jgi:tRNA threonylcarbamoyladenosine biosynthesis protein TsaB
MALILNIDTATTQASVCLAKDEIVLKEMFNKEQKDHAAWIQPAVKVLLQETGYSLTNINAIAVTAGPGSYTGLRVSMATAKGLCYALNIPLITESTLKVMAACAKKQLIQKYLDGSSALLCPMIDARRMEVFTTIYNADLEEVQAPGALILEQDSFRSQLQSHEIVFFGDGAAKWKHVCNNTNASFLDDIVPSAGFLAALAATAFQRKSFSDIAYSEPVYLKEFYSYTKR